MANSGGNILNRVRSIFRPGPDQHVSKFGLTYSAYQADGTPIAPTDLGKQYAPDYFVVERRGSNKEYRFDQYMNPESLIERKGLYVFRQMMTDGEVRRAVNEKKYSVISADWEIQPGDDDPAAKDQAEFIEYVFQNMPRSLPKMVYEMLDGVVNGFSVCEIVFKPIDGGEYAGKWGIGEYKYLDPTEIEFNFDEFGKVTNVLQDTPAGSPIVIPKEKAFLYTYNPEYGRVWGNSDLRPVYKHWWSKDFLLKWWNIFMETNAMPTRVGKYPSQSSSAGQATRLKEVLRDIVNNTAITIPDDMSIDFIQTSGDGGFEKAIQYHDTQIARGIIGQTLTSSEGQRVGSMALGNVHQETKADYVTFLRDDVTETFRDGIIRRLMELNFAAFSSVPYLVFQPRKGKLIIASVADVKTLMDSGMLVEDDFNTIRNRLDLPTVNKYVDGSVETLKAPVVPQAGGFFELKPVPQNEPEPAATEYARSNADIVTALKEDESDPDVFHPFRPLTEAEKACGGVSYFAARKKELTNNTKKYIKELSPIFGEIRRAMTTDIQKNVIVGDKVMTTALNNLSVPKPLYEKYLLAMTDILQDEWKNEYFNGMKLTKQSAESVPAKTSIAAYSVTRADVSYYESKRDKIASEQPVLWAVSRYSAYAAAAVGLSPVVPQATMDEIDKWNVAGDLAKVSIVRKKIIDQGLRAVTEKFWITDVTNDQILSDVKKAINAGISSGENPARIMDRVKTEFDKYEVSGKVTTPQRLEAITRTNTTRARTDADLAAYSDPAVMDEFPYVQYTAVIDVVTTDTCLELDGTIYASDDADLAWIKPPNHFNCRSELIPVNKVDEAVKDGPSEKPDRKIIPVEFGGDGEKKWQKAA